MLCKKCHKRISKGEAVWKTRAPIWFHNSFHTSWWFYSGWFCKKCARQTDRNSKFLRNFFIFWLIFVLVLSIITPIFIIKSS